MPAPALMTRSGARVPRDAEARSEVVFLGMPQRRALRGECHGCQIIHAGHGKGKGAIGR